MKQASNLKELQAIRAYNREYLDKINGNLGTALGYKKRTDSIYPSMNPAVIVFVPFKIKKKWLPYGTEIKEKLEGPNGLWCYLDVVQSNKAMELDKIEDSSSEIVERLRGWDDKIWMGAQVSVNVQGGYSFGTLGCFVKNKGNNKLGILTNKHVAGDPGTLLNFPVPHGIDLAITKESYEYVEDELWYSDVDEPNTYFRIDCAYAELTDHVDEGDIKNEILTKGGLGKVMDIDLNNMDVIGKRVMRIGRTTGLRYGTVAAFGYEYIDDENVTVYTDLLIIGDDGEQFSTYGDSGSLIVTNDENRNPIALLWGGWKEKLRTGKQQEDWTYAVGLKRVLDKLNLEVL